jgi:hypothetical protein
VDRTIVDRLCGFSERGACTDAERRAAAMLHDELRARGHEAWVESRWVRPQASLSVALHAAIAVAASLASVALPLPAAIAAGATALSLAVEAAGRTSPLRLLFPRRATQHVLTVPSPGRIPLIVAANYDVPRRGVGARLRRRWLPWLVACCAAIAGAAAARASGVEGTWLGALQLVPTVALLGALGAALDAMAAGWSSEDAPGVAVAIALHDELTRNPPRALAPALLLHGAGASGPQALRAHLRREKLNRRTAIVLAVGPDTVLERALGEVGALDAELLARQPVSA